MNDWAILKSHAQKCLDEVSWNTWSIDSFLGQGAWSFAVLLKKGNRQCVLLLTKPNMPPLAKPGVSCIVQLYQSAAKIRIHCRHVGLPVAKTIESPRKWSGGAAVLLSRVPGQDLEHRLKDPALNASCVGASVAHMVQSSQVLGCAHRKHYMGFGNHIFGKPPRHLSGATAWVTCISPLFGKDEDTDVLIGRLKAVAEEMLNDAPKTTQIWDVGDRNIMLNEEGDVVGLVDQVDLFTGDAMFVPGFSLAMLGDIHKWEKLDQYAQAWRKTWNMTNEEWTRVHLHRLSCFGRFVGKDLSSSSLSWSPIRQEQELRSWQQSALEFLSR